MNIPNLIEARPRYKVADNDFNRANYPNLIGKEYHKPPGYAAVIPIQENNKTIIQPKFSL